MYITNDFKCLNCFYEFEEMWNKKHGDDSEKPWEGIVACPECASGDLQRLVSATNIDTMSLMDRPTMMASMKKRSADHSKKLLKKDRDKVQKQLNKRPGRVGA